MCDWDQRMGLESRAWPQTNASLPGTVAASGREALGDR
jgi:hypothetical protein